MRDAGTYLAKDKVECIQLAKFNGEKPLRCLHSWLKPFLRLTFGQVCGIMIAVLQKEGWCAMLIGRERECADLRAAMDSDKSEFVAVYGRRRVGKTYLIRETFSYSFAFEHTGVKGADQKRQLYEFGESLR